MKRYKTVALTSSILLFFSILYIVLLTNKKMKSDFVKETTIELLDEMILESRDDFAEHFKYFEARNFVLNDMIDSFYIIKNQENSFHSAKLMDYYDRMVLGNPVIAKEMFNILHSIQDQQSQDFKLIAKLAEYHFVKKIIEDYGYLCFFWLDGFNVNVCSQKDTIQIGEEYTAKIGYRGSILNKEQQPIVVLDGDTLNADQGYCLFKEKPKTKGLMKHKGYMTYFHPIVGIGELDLEFEYYVK